MFGLIIFLSEFFFRVYLSVNLIEEPTYNNYLLFVFFFNLYICGYLWTFYLVVLYVGSFVIREPQIVSIIIQPLMSDQSYVDLVMHYCHKMYHHQEVQRYLLLVKKYGSYLMTIIKYFLVWCLKTVILDQLPVQLQTHGQITTMIDNEMWKEIHRILQDLEILSQLHQKIS